mgnify:FL=1
MINKPFCVTVSSLLLLVALSGCGAARFDAENGSAPSVHIGSQPSAASSTASSPAAADSFAYQDQACDPMHPLIASRNIRLPRGVGPESRTAAACIAIEWLRNERFPIPRLEIVRSPAVDTSRGENDAKGILTMERILGPRFTPQSAPILLLLIGDDQAWACEYGKRSIDPRMPKNSPFYQGESSWSDEWLGCSKGKSALPWGGSNIELSDGTRFVFSSCTPADCAAAPENDYEASLALRSGHELVHILQLQLGRQREIPGFDWMIEGVPIYFDMAAAWLAGYSGNWRALEEKKTPYEAWRKEHPAENVSIALLDHYDWERMSGTKMQMRWAIGQLATEYIVAHWGIDALFAMYRNGTDGLPGDVVMRTLGISKPDLYLRIDAYLQSELE